MKEKGLKGFMKKALFGKKLKKKGKKVIKSKNSDTAALQQFGHD